MNKCVCASNIARMNKAATIPLVAALFVAVKSAQTAKHCCDGWRITRGTLDLVFLAMETGKLDGMDTGPTVARC